jgi:hypothetical protein
MNSIASHRPYGWARAWRDLGHEVHVLTPAKRAYDGPMDLDCDLAGVHVHEAGRAPRSTQAPRAASDARWERLKSATRRARASLAMFGDPRLLSYSALVREGRRLLADARFDLIVATSPPEVGFFAARTLARASGVPWVADFRDAWFHDTRLQHSRIAASAAGPVNRWLVRDAAALVTVSEGLRKRLANYLRREVLLSYNGYFEEDAPASTRHEASADGRVHIVYTGRVYPGRQDPEPLFRALAVLKREPGDPAARIVVDFYGFDNPWLAALVARYPLGDQVRLHGHVAHRASLAAQRAADALLFLDWSDASAEGVLTGKLFEYIGSGRTILALGPRPDSEAAALIERTGSGVTLVSEEALTAYLRRLVVAPSAPPARGAAWERLSRGRQARALLEALRARVVLRAAGSSAA